MQSTGLREILHTAMPSLGDGYLQSVSAIGAQHATLVWGLLRFMPPLLILAFLVVIASSCYEELKLWPTNMWLW